MIDVTHLASTCQTAEGEKGLEFLIRQNHGINLETGPDRQPASGEVVQQLFIIHLAGVLFRYARKLARFIGWGLKILNRRAKKSLLSSRIKTHLLNGVAKQRPNLH